jgi:hypothetical protein
MHDKLLLERYSAGETNEEDSRRIEEHCKTCVECAGYLGRLNIERQEFLAAHPFPRLVLSKPAVIRSLWYQPFLDKLRQPALFPAYGLIVVLLMLSPVVYFKSFHHTVSDEITFKGGNSISFLLKRSGKISECTPQDTLIAGDEIQVLYSTAKKGYISLLSVDSRGAISWYHPDQKSLFCSVAAKAGGKQNYPAGILLDESQGQELIIALFSDSPLATKSVTSWVADVMQKTNTNLFMLRRQLDSTGDKIHASPVTAIFKKKAIAT